MINPLTWLSRRRFPYQPLITVEISRNRLLHNLHEFRKLAPKMTHTVRAGFSLKPVQTSPTPIGMVAPVLKSNAYGHGFQEVAAILRHETQIPFFVVDSYFEALALRSAGVRAQILIMGYTRPETILHSHLSNTVFTITSLETLRHLEETTNRIPVHLKIDSGMHRQGILPDEVERATELLSENPLIVLKGICSHLCDADNVDPSFTEGQINTWNKIARHFKAEFSTLEYIHLAATDGHRYTGDIEANVSRLGIGLYGLVDAHGFTPALDLLPVMSMKTIITSIKKISRDMTVGYGNTFEAQKDMTIATIPAGYYEGVDRRLSNIGSIGVGQENAVCSIVGRVSMNITTLDVSHLTDIHIGTPVTVVSNNTTDQNSILSIAKKCGTIPYEIAVHVPAQLKRVIVE